MNNEELKSAFEIEGFSEGKTKICTIGIKGYWQIEDGEIFHKRGNKFLKERRTAEHFKKKVFNVYKERQNESNT